MKKALRELKQLAYLTDFSFYLSDAFLKRLLEVASAHPKATKLKRDLENLLQGEIPTEPSVHMPSLIVYALTGKLYDIGASRVVYEPDLAGFLLRAYFWFSHLYKTSHGSEFLNALRKATTMLYPDTL